MPRYSLQSTTYIHHHNINVPKRSPPKTGNRHRHDSQPREAVRTWSMSVVARCGRRTAWLAPLPAPTRRTPTVVAPRNLSGTFSPPVRCHVGERLMNFAAGLIICQEPIDVAIVQLPAQRTAWRKTMRVTHAGGVNLVGLTKGRPQPI